MTRKMKDSGVEWIREIPENWEIIPGKRIFKSNKKIVGNKADEYERLALTLNGVVKRSKEDIDGLQPAKFETYQILQKNELVFKLIDLENIRTSRVGLSSYTGIVSPAYIVLTSNEEDIRFYYYWYISMYYNNIFNMLGDAGVRSSINQEELLKIPIVQVSREEHILIANYLDKKTEQLDSITQDIEKEIKLLEEYKKSVIYEAVTKGLDPDAKMKDSGVEWIGDIPYDWKINKLKYLTTKAERGTTPKYTEDNKLSQVVNQATFSQGFFDKSDIRYSSIFPEQSRGLLIKNDILLASTGGGVLGKVHYFEEVEDNYVADGHVTVIRTDQNIQNSKLIYYTLYINYDMINETLAKGSTNQTELQSSLLNDLYIPYPSLEEQNLIVDYLDKKTLQIDQIIDDKQKQLDILSEYKKSLIYEYVTGKKEVPHV